MKWVMFCVCCWSLTAAGAEWSCVDVCAAPGSLDNPAVCGSRVVWQNGGDGRIYTRLMPDGDAVAVYPTDGTQSYPAVSGSVVVWQETGGSLKGIYAYDLDSDTLTIVSESQTHAMENPAIDGRYVVWQDNRNGGFDIYGYDLQTGLEFPVCTAAGDQYWPSVSGSRVVWSDTRNGWNIYGIDLYDPDAGEFLISVNDDAIPNRAVISGDNVVWQDNRNGNRDIFGFNLSTGVEFPICVYAQHQEFPAIYGDWVVWRDRRNGAEHIYVYHLQTEQTASVCPTPNLNQNVPAVSGRYIVWRQDVAGGGFSIVGAELPVAFVATLTVFGPDEGQMLLAGAEYEILWQTDGDAVDDVAITFSADAGDTWQTLAETVPNTGSLVVAMSDVDSHECLIRISVAGMPTIFGQSDAFTVFQCDPKLTADLTGDCYVGLADFAEFAAQWLLSGNPYDPDWRLD